MSKGVDKIQVFRTTRVRNALKKDGSWIHQPKGDKEEEKDVGPSQSADGNPAVTKQKSYVLQTARRFGAIDSSVILHPQTTKVTPSEGPQASTVEEIHNGGAQPEKPAAEEMPENGEAQTVISVVELSEALAADATLDIPVEECAQADSAEGEETEAVSPVKPAEQALSSQNAVNKDPPVPDNSETEVSAEANVKSPDVDGSCIKGPPEDDKSVDVNEESHYVIHASPEEDVQVSVESVPDIVESVTKPPPQFADEIITDGPEEPRTDERVEDGSAVIEESTLAVTNVTQKEEDAGHDGVQTVPDVVSEIPASAAGSTAALALVCEGDSAPQNELNTTTEQDVEGKLDSPTSQEERVQIAAHGKCEDSSAPQEKSFVKTPTKEFDDCESKPLSNIETTKEEGTVCEAQTEPQDHLIIKTITVAELETEIEPILQVEPVLNTTNEEAEEQSGGGIPEDQRAEPEPKITEDPDAELNMEDSTQPETVSDAGIVQNKEVNLLIELTDALDVEPPPIISAPEPVKDPEAPQTEEPKQNKQKAKTDFNGLCSFCHQKLDGPIKITLSDPAVTCHPDCLKCGVCARVLGDFLSPMFLQGQVIQCGSCVTRAPRI
ncbi:titin homolog [Gouania willdenowi]|uniref:titin homolog n=1 Tax=Gouania willdenowi TaxID=441366 RepID=UPI0010566C2A|nr:titin homolog [Gouania willdenowi]